MQKTILRTMYTILAAAIGLALSSSYISSALADSPHFVGTPTCQVTSASKSSATLTCTANKIAGLGTTNPTVSITLSADVTSICQNNGGNPPTGQQGPAPASTTGTFFVRNGAVSPYSQTLTGTSNLKCNGGGLSVCWHFDNVQVLVEGVYLKIPGTFKSSNCIV